jgi:hypothetical protein
MEHQTNKKSEVSPATTLPWPFSPHSDLEEDEKEPTTTPARTQNVPKEITAGKFNTTGKKYTLPDEDEVTVDLLGIAHQIESQERGFAYEQEEQLVKEVEEVTQNDRAAAEAARDRAEERELQAIEEAEIEKLKEANAKKKRKASKNTTKKQSNQVETRRMRRTMTTKAKGKVVERTCLPLTS